jgi:hypothetical protein
VVILLIVDLIFTETSMRDGRLVLIAEDSACVGDLLAA